MSKTHVVRQGDHISAIAAGAGFGDFRLIWDHPENAALAKVRDPHALLPGDRIFIPDREDKQETRATDAVHTFVAEVPKLFLRLKLLDVDGQPLRGVGCELTLPPASEAVPKSADGDAIVEERIPRMQAIRGELLAHPPQKPPLSGERDARYDLHVGDLDPHTELTGQQARLSNLGYFAGYGALDIDALVWAAEEFRCDQGTKRAKTRPKIKPPPAPVEGEPPPRDPEETSGIDDAALVKKLRDVHGV